MPYREISRRRLIAGAAAAGVAAALPAGLRGQPAGSGGDDVRVLRAGPIDPGAPTRLGYDGSAPGPVLRVRRGSDLKLRLVNGLGEPTALDLHGLRGAGALAAPPRRPSAAPGESMDVRVACADAGTFWYHAVRPDQARRGLYGVVVVEESEAVAVDRDVPLVIADALTPRDGTAALLANGAFSATLPVQANERVRLRLVNAASTILAVRIERHRTLVMALDGQPCDPFVARDGRVFLAPGNRADLFVDAELGPGSTAAIVAETETGAATVATLAYADTARRAGVLAPPSPLPPNDLPARMDFAGALKLDCVLAGAATDIPAAPAFSVRRGRAVMLALINRTTAAQTARVGGQAFRLLDRLDDGWKPFWLDTLAVPPNATHRIAFVPDSPGGYLIEATDPAGTRSLSTWFEVS